MPSTCAFPPPEGKRVVFRDGGLASFLGCAVDGGAGGVGRGRLGIGVTSGVGAGGVG